MRKAVEQNGGMAVGGMLGFDTCIRSSCTSTIEMGWSNSILQPQVLLERPFSPPKPLAQLPRERGRQLGLQPVCEPKRRSSDQLHDRRRVYRLAGLRTPQAGPIDQCHSSSRLDRTELHSYRGSYTLWVRACS